MFKIIELMPHQKDALEATETFNKVAYYLDMGLGKTFVGSEKAVSFGVKILVVCQKSKIEEWIDHFQKHYQDHEVYNLTKPKQLATYYGNSGNKVVGVINYDSVWRKSEFTSMKGFTLMLDESSMVKHRTSKRTKYILKLKAKNVILLSGTPTGGKYEELVSQCNLLGWKISESDFWKAYVNYFMLDLGGFQTKKVTGYKNVEGLKSELARHGAIFMKTEEVLDLPDKIEKIVSVPNTRSYFKFQSDGLIYLTEGDKPLLGDTPVKRLLYSRMLASTYNENKYNVLVDMLDETLDRMVIFYQFDEERRKLKELCEKKGRPVSVICGSEKDLTHYEHDSNSITLVQYQAGAMGLNLQKSNKIIYFTLPLSAELYIQSMKRIHRIGQTKTCIYYYLQTANSLEYHILDTLKKREDYNDKLFEGVV